MRRARVAEPWKQRLLPFGELYSEMERALRDRLLAMTDAELAQIIDDAGQLTEQNCWWAIYRVAPVIVHEARVILYDRERTASKGGT